MAFIQVFAGVLSFFLFGFGAMGAVDTIAADEFRYSNAAGKAFGGARTEDRSAGDSADVAGFPALFAHESFSNYVAGKLPGQNFRGSGFAAGTWISTTSDAAAVTTDSGLTGSVTASGGMVTVKGDDSTVWGKLGSGVRTTGLVDTATGLVGGGSVHGALYVSFLFRAAADNRREEYGGLQLMRGSNGDTGILIGNSPVAWGYSLYQPMVAKSVDLKSNGGTGNHIDMDHRVHLLVAKISYHADADDECRVWMDPDPTSSETDQSSSVHTGTLSGDFSFDRFALRGGGPTHPFDFDEIRFGTTWNSVLPAAGPQELADNSIAVKLNPDGTIRSMAVFRDDEWENVAFRSDDYRGPAWRISDVRGTRSIPLSPADATRAFYTGTDGDLRMALGYRIVDGRLVATARIENTGTTAWSPTRAGLLLGLDTYMESYPSWNDLYFPTLLRCEKTHFWGYAMTPRGRILGVASPDPVASWHHEYERGAHRIFTFGLDFLNRLPLPARHPQDLTSLQPGESRSWTVVIADVPNSDPVSVRAVLPALAEMSEAPMIETDRYTGEPGEVVNLTFWGDPVEASLRAPNGAETKLTLTPASDGTRSAKMMLPENFGLYEVSATNADGRTTNASINVRRPWSWYLGQARRNAVDKPQKDAGAQCEGYYGFYSMFLAKRWFPNAGLDAKSEAKFKELYPLMFDPRTGLPTQNPSRIQNSAAMAGILADRYLAGGDISDLDRASALCDFLVGAQRADGGYYNHGTNYTSVIYPGKSIMEVMTIEERLGRTDRRWHDKYVTHESSVRKAMDHLALNLDNIGTEGQATFEDGMISCSATQLGMFALLEKDAPSRRKYSEAAAFFASAHRCLDQLVTPDARQNGGTLRFWESQYDVITRPNMMSSPHGWSAWNIYSRWYLYQLTGNVEYLRQAMNALGSCTQVIDSATGDLRWAFISDPFVEATVFVDNPHNRNPKTQGKFVEKVVGEQYLPMISGWCRAPRGKSVSLYSGNDGGSNDNDVHEIFKCLEEVALTSAYVVIHADGTVETWNCHATRSQDGLTVTPSESIVRRIHVNAPVPTTVSLNFHGRVVTRQISGAGWQEAPSTTTYRK